ncbi:hypothetical protein JD844_013479 [Phrynosoma platyrhinos]|uniref:Ig-like domain-containing protein n=1 Tax=Phrynosoma platyrhinos TaxID=52577 RepID=A0ABQ7TKW0_PHRPL|nr:hypothetical protein JD844_013479 [Phrynosoma platyrhinos]
MKVDAGSEVPIPCSLKGPKVTWFWVPRYPICAGLKDDKEEKAIYSVISSGIIETNERFQNRLTVENQKPDNSSILTLRFLYMNDSGVFYCSAGQAKSPQISVTVKPGLIRKTLRNSIKIKRHYRQYFGLWKCIHPSCLTQFDGYCLENDSETSKSEADMETTTVSVTDVTMMANPHVIGGSIAGLLILLLVCVIIFIICRRRHSHGVSPSGARDPETQESKEPAGSRGRYPVLNSRVQGDWTAPNQDR